MQGANNAIAVLLRCDAVNGWGESGAELNSFQAERQHQVDLQSLPEVFRSKFSAVRIDQFPRRLLTERPLVGIEVDLAQVPPQPAEGEANLDAASGGAPSVPLCIRMGGKPALRARVATGKIERSGMLSGYGIWWSAQLGSEVVTNSPDSKQRSWKQLIRWLDQPRFVEAGDDIQVLTCYNDHQVNVEDIFVTPSMIDQYQKTVGAAQ